MAFALEMEKELKKPVKKEGLSEDQAVAAYAEFMGGDGNPLTADPAQLLA